MILELLLRVLVEKALQDEALKKFIGNPFIQRVNKIRQVSGQFKDPTAFFNSFVRSLNQAQLKELNQNVNKFIRTSNFRKLYVNSLQKSLGNTTHKQAKDFFLKTQAHLAKKEVETLPDIKTSRPLYSSWLSHGTFYPAYRTGLDWYGILDLTVKTGAGKTYTYYNVPYQVWEDMLNGGGTGKGAITGKGLGGAGTTFWAEYLDKYSLSISKKGVASMKHSELNARLTKQRNILTRELKRETTSTGFRRGGYRIPKASYFKTKTYRKPRATR